jgi:hypothetical protein
MKNKVEDVLQVILIVLGLAFAYYTSASSNELGLMMLLLITIFMYMGTQLLTERKIKLEMEALVAHYEFERKIEGSWIERYHFDKETIMTYGLIDIRYDKSSKTTHLKGSVYDSAGTLLANWASKSVYSDRIKKSIIYIYDGESTDSRRLAGNGYAKIDFYTNKLDQLVSASGCFEDNSTDFKPINFELDRLDKDLCNKAIGKDGPEFSYEKAKIIVAYHSHINKFKPT